MTLEALFAAQPESEAEFKACCAAFYESAAVRFLLGDSWRPGGTSLTREVAVKAGIGSGSLVLDIACGSGDSAQVTAGELGAKVVGLDLSADSLGAAAGRFSGEGWWANTAWAAGEAESLPFTSESFDVVMVECALCTFPSKDAAISEVRRVLKPDGRFVIADVTLEKNSLPADLALPMARVACLADALPVEEYEELLRHGGFAVECVQDCATAAGDFLAGIDKKLLLARIAQAVGNLNLEGIDIKEARRLIALARESAAKGTLSYAYLVGRKLQAVSRD